jgi:hypothetical protein
MHSPFTVRESPAQVIWKLHRGRLHKPLLHVVPEYNSPLYRVEWPDIGPSPPANLTRCKAAALEWAERQTITEGRKINAARRLKSLNNFSWSRSLVRLNGRGAP